MKTTRSFILFSRIGFVFFTLLFIKEAFYKWDGYSFYMRFMDFLPDLSLSFILWTILSVISILLLWFFIYGIVKITSKSIIKIGFEHVIGWIVVSVVLKRVISFIGTKFFFEYIFLSNFLVWIISIILAATVVWFVRKYVEKILYEVNAYVTPLVWLFTFLFVLAVPFSTLEKELPETKYIPADSSRVISSNKKHPNIILVIMDTLAAEDMQVYGYNRPTTPFILKWAKDAVLFKNAYASANWTTPATMSIMTGERPWTHRVWYQAFYHHVSNYKKSLPKLLKDNGYAVYGFVQNPSAHPEILGIKDVFLMKEKYYSFWESSDWWYDKLVELFYNRPIVERWIFREYSHILIRLLNYSRPALPTTIVPPERVYNRFLEYISKDYIPDQPFFAWLHLFPPHDPYLPPKPYRGKFGDAKKLNTDVGQEKSELFHMKYGPERQKDVDILRKWYDEFILYSDQQFKLFLSRLAETIDTSNTIIILLSDHGESFSHGYQGHGSSYLYESIIRVPLIIKLPWENNNKLIDAPVEHIDVPPTILDFAGIPVPAWMEGRSLLPLLEGSIRQPKPVFSMQLIKNRVIGNSPITKGAIAVRDGDYKLIYYLEDKKTLLFNLVTDPDEILNISKEKPHLVQNLVRLINDNLSRANAKITQSVKK